jgi:hypothetical protein
MKRAMKPFSPRGPALGAAALSILVSLNLLGCSNSLLEEARGAQAKAAAPRIGVFKADGTALASEGSLDFGELSVGKGESLALTLKNSGVNDLVVAAADAAIAPGSGTAAGIFSLDSYAGLTIKAGESGSLKIAFSPAAAAIYAATLTIASNDIAQPLFKLSLSGKGSATAKALTSFGFPSIPAVGIIDETSKTVAVTAPIDTNPTALVATFESTGTKVLVGSTPQASGSTVNSFASPLTYTVAAQDGSTADYVVTLTLKKVVPILTTGSLSNITTNSASGSGTIVSTGDGSAAVSASGLCWATTQNPTVGGAGCSTASGSATSGTFNASLSSLVSGTTYYVRAYAKNTSMVDYGYGPQLSFTTLPAQPTISSAAPVGYPAGSGKIHVAWSAVAGATSYDVYASQSSTPPTNVSSPTTGGIAVTATSCDLKGLENYKTHYVWVRAKNATGDGAWSSSATSMVGVPVTGVSLYDSNGVVISSALDAPIDMPIYVKALPVPDYATEAGITWSSSDTTNFSIADYSSSVMVNALTSAKASMTLTATSKYAGAVRSKTCTVNTGVPRSSLMAEYLFSGGSLADTSSCSNTATATAWCASVADRAGAANGAFYKNYAYASSAMSLGTSLSFWGQQNVSVSLWVKADSLPATGNYPPIIGQSSSANCFQWDLHLSPSGLVAMVGEYKKSPFEVTSAISTGVWYHAALVYNGSKLTFYVNNASAGTATYGGSAGSPASSPYVVGLLDATEKFSVHSTGTTGVAFYFDDIRIYNKALTAAEVASLYNH